MNLARLPAPLPCGHRLVLAGTRRCFTCLSTAPSPKEPRR